jgi:hypothetical protein
MPFLFKVGYKYKNLIFSPLFCDNPPRLKTDYQDLDFFFRFGDSSNKHDVR